MRQSIIAKESTCPENPTFQQLKEGIDNIEVGKNEFVCTFNDYDLLEIGIKQNYKYTPISLQYNLPFQDQSLSIESENTFSHIFITTNYLNNSNLSIDRYIISGNINENISCIKSQLRNMTFQEAGTRNFCMPILVKGDWLMMNEGFTGNNMMYNVAYNLNDNSRIENYIYSNNIPANNLKVWTGCFLDNGNGNIYVKTYYDFTNDGQGGMRYTFNTSTRTWSEGSYRNHVNGVSITTTYGRNNNIIKENPSSTKALIINEQAQTVYSLFDFSTETITATTIPVVFSSQNIQRLDDDIFTIKTCYYSGFPEESKKIYKINLFLNTISELFDLSEIEKEISEIVSSNSIPKGFFATYCSKKVSEEKDIVNIIAGCRTINDYNLFPNQIFVVVLENYQIKHIIPLLPIGTANLNIEVDNGGQIIPANTDFTPSRNGVNSTSATSFSGTFKCPVEVTLS